MARAWPGPGPGHDRSGRVVSEPHRGTPPATAP